MGDISGVNTFDIPKECIAGVVTNEGPDFILEVKKVPVPEIGTSKVNHSESDPPAVIHEICAGLSRVLNRDRIKHR